VTIARPNARMATRWGDALARLAGLAAVLLAPLLCGCQTCLDRPWGRDLCLLPSGERIGWAALRAATDPYTLIPAAGAAIFAAGDLDQQVSEWARRETPVFGSTDNASSAGPTFRNIVMAGAGITAFATPSGGPPQWGANKAKGIAVETAAALAPQGIALWLKNATNRERPNAKDDLSFPSGTSAEAAAWAAMGRRNTRALPIGSGYRAGIEGALMVCTGLTAWSRVENGSHYPSDVLAGIALGNFTSLLIHDALLGPSWRDFQLGIAPRREAMVFNLSMTMNP
jgi:membrane-associated phospholipid phosphatase